MEIKIEDSKIIIGINWGIIEEIGWFSAKGFESVDLDLNLIAINSSNEIVKKYNWKNKDSSIIENSNDDNTGDIFINDKKDNEYAIINIDKLETDQKFIVYLNNYTEQELGNLIHLDYRIYSGLPNEPEKVYRFFNLKEIEKFDNSYGIVLGYFEYIENSWYYIKSEKKINLLFGKGKKTFYDKIISIVEDTYLT